MENTILFPRGEGKLTESVKMDLAGKFEEFEENVIGKGKHDELHTQLNNFNKKYLK